MKDEVSATTTRNHRCRFATWRYSTRGRTRRSHPRTRRSAVGSNRSTFAPCVTRTHILTSSAMRPGVGAVASSTFFEICCAMVRAIKSSNNIADHDASNASVRLAKSSDPSQSEPFQNAPRHVSLADHCGKTAEIVHIVVGLDQSQDVFD